MCLSSFRVLVMAKFPLIVLLTIALLGVPLTASAIPLIEVNRLLGYYMPDNEPIPYAQVVRRIDNLIVGDQVYDVEFRYGVGVSVFNINSWSGYEYLLEEELI